MQGLLIRYGNQTRIVLVPRYSPFLFSCYPYINDKSVESGLETWAWGWAWDLSVGLQDGRLRQIHWAMAAPQAFHFIHALVILILMWCRLFTLTAVRGIFKDFGLHCRMPSLVHYSEHNYQMPWCRFSPYVWGILLGYALHVTKKKQFKISKVPPNAR